MNVGILHLYHFSSFRGWNGPFSTKCTCTQHRRMCFHIHICVVESIKAVRVPARAKSWAGPPVHPLLSPRRRRPPGTWARGSAPPALSRAWTHEALHRVFEREQNVRGASDGPYRRLRERSTRETGACLRSTKTFCTGDLCPLLFYTLRPLLADSACVCV